VSPGDGIPPRKSADKNLGEIVAEVSEKASLLVREEIELAKAEVTSKVSKLGKGGGIGVAAGVFAVFGVAMLCHFFAWFLNDLFDWSGSVWPGYGIVALLLFLLAALAGYIASRLFQQGKTLTPDLAIEEAKRTRAQLETQNVEQDQLKRSLDAARGS
jgi:Putative Actinobacterial Holin-X, holin superfamily III